MVKHLLYHHGNVFVVGVDRNVTTSTEGDVHSSTEGRCIHVTSASLAVRYHTGVCSTAISALSENVCIEGKLLKQKDNYFPRASNMEYIGNASAS